ncbi:glycosyltransferase family 2 protein [Acinetobacter sp. ANC 5584]
MISIVTATYNRENLLERVYNSLINQTNKEFEWIVVDDGSQDNTKELIKNFMCNSYIDMTYIYKNNGGKHTALNIGIVNAKYDFTFFLDSDDFLLNDSIEVINNKINYIKKLNNFERISGVCGNNGDINGNLIGTQLSEEKVINYLDFRYKYQVKGDKTEVFKTSILKKFMFPVFPNERFCPEALVWNRISNEYDMYFFNEIIYIRDYQDEGLSQKIFEVRKKSPKATLLYYKEFFLNSRISNIHRLKALLNYFRFRIYLK